MVEFQEPELGAVGQVRCLKILKSVVISKDLYTLLSRNEKVSSGKIENLVPNPSLGRRKKEGKFLQAQ